MPPINLHIVVPHVQKALATLAADGERFDHDVVRRLALFRMPLFELLGLFPTSSSSVIAS